MSKSLLLAAALIVVSTLVFAQPRSTASSAETANVSVAKQWYEAFNTKNTALIEQIIADTWTDIPSPPGTPPGPVALKKTLIALTTSFPDLHLQIEDVIEAGDKVVVRSVITGTQREAFFGIPSRGRRMSIQAVDIHEIKDGKILRTWHTEDWMTGLRQLGAIGS